MTPTNTRDEQHLSALNQARDKWDFINNELPKCPHCGQDVDISENDLWRLYEEGEHDVTCPNCDRDFLVVAEAKYSFSTDQQDEL